jgi:hypothetical protein
VGCGWSKGPDTPETVVVPQRAAKELAWGRDLRPYPILGPKAKKGGFNTMTRNRDLYWTGRSPTQ